MSIYNRVYQHLIFPALERLQHTCIQKELEFLNKSQWWSQKDLKKYQLKQLKALIRHAYRTVPYYRKIFKQIGLQPDDIGKLEDLERVPLLTKEDIRNNFSELLSTDYLSYRPVLNSSSGSTGKPLVYYQTIRGISTLWAAGYRGWGWAGYERGDKYVTLGGSSLLPSHMSLKKRIRYLLERNMPLSSFNMDPIQTQRYIEKIAKFKPKYIRGYPSSLYILAKYIDQNNKTPFQPRAVFTTAETLLKHQREFIERTFGCEVFDGYGCRDGSVSAMECPEHQGYHISAEQAILEFLPQDPGIHHGSFYEIITTDLSNYSMPFIRYRTGDIGIPDEEPCSCGRGLPIIKKIEGRLINLILRSDGALVSGLPLTDIFEHIQMECDAIREYQIIQEKNKEISVTIVKGDEFSSLHEELIRREFRQYLGEGIEIRIEYSSEIPETSAGKRLYVISKLS
ncbi:MAG: hypothetical protein QHG99_08615 [Methanomicrobiales archaeon]|nr:hypothetical protein [Methanomicrobiales archaeon]